MHLECTTQRNIEFRINIFCDKILRFKVDHIGL